LATAIRKSIPEIWDGRAVDECSQARHGVPDGRLASGSEESFSQKTIAAATRALEGERTGWKAVTPFFGPAIVASVAYLDPGNIATNFQAGARQGYELLWVVLLSNLAAMLLQSLSARIGIVTGRNLAELSRVSFSRPVVHAMWVAAEAAAIATDLAEFVGGAVGVSLLFHLPLVVAMAPIALGTYLGLMLQTRGFRPLELVITAMVLIIGASFLTELVIAPPSWHSAVLHTFLPSICNSDAVPLAAAILGATVMPHAIYLHSNLTQDRIPSQNVVQKRKLLRLSNREIVVSLGFAGVINVAMLAASASAFHGRVYADLGDLFTAYRMLLPVLGRTAVVVFSISLIASGLSSSIVGTMASQVIMQGFVGIRIPLWVRRLVTMAPAFAVIAAGVNATQALVSSQIVLSFVLPIPMISLIFLSSRRDIMGVFTIRRPILGLTILATIVVLAINTSMLIGFGSSLAG
jgi:manganese transport protein